MATHSSILAENIPWAEESGGLQFIGSQRVRRDLATEHAHNLALQETFWIMTLTCASLIHKTYSSLLNLLNVSEQIKLKQSIYDITPYKKMLSNWSWKDYSSSSSSTHGLLKFSLHLMTIIQNTWAGTGVTAINLSSSESKLLNFLFMSSSCEEMENLSRLWMRERRLLKGRARMLPETEKWAKMGCRGENRTV